MKKLILIACSLMLCLNVQANHFEDGKEVYVTAPSGLNMRTSPDKDAQVLYYLQYGDRVHVVQYQSEDHPLRLDWIDGSWVKVSFEGVEGYVFDGYLSSLPVPKYDFELCKIDMDVVYPLESYFSHHFGGATSYDTLINLENHKKVVEILSNGQRIVKTHKPGFYKLEIYMDHVRVTDLHNLIMGMFTEKSERAEYKSKSVFYEDHEGHVNKIKVGIDSPIEIKKLRSGQLKITAYSYYDGC